MVNSYRIVTLKERMDLKEKISLLHHLAWVPYMGEDPVALKHWNKLLTLFSDYQYLLIDDEENAIACGNSIPFYWNGEVSNLPSGWDGVLEKGMQDYQNQIESNSVSALAIVIHPAFQGKGISERMVREMKALVKQNQIQYMVAPVRPTLKSHYPLIPMHEYMNWKREDGMPFDPWIRTHYKTGAEILCEAERSMFIPGRVEQWEKWTGMAFPATGEYIIPDGLVPLEINREKDKGVYIEPNVWMRHYLD